MKKCFLPIFIFIIVNISCHTSPKKLNELNKIYLDTIKPKIKLEQHQDEEQAVIIAFDYGKKNLDPLFALESRLEKVIDENHVGEYDGNEIAVDKSDGLLYMYGPNAENIFKVIRPILDQTDFMKGAKVKLRFGPPEDGVKETTIIL